MERDNDQGNNINNVARRRDNDSDNNNGEDENGPKSITSEAETSKEEGTRPDTGAEADSTGLTRPPLSGLAVCGGVTGGGRGYRGDSLTDRHRRMHKQAQAETLSHVYIYICTQTKALEYTRT